MTDQYEDIINLPHPVSSKHPQMSMEERAAQFAPFAALSGYGEEIDEASRITYDKIDLSDNKMNVINNNLLIIKDNIKSKPMVIITYFVSDDKKNGGYYKTCVKNVKKIDDVYKKIIFSDNSSVSMNDVLNLQMCDDFKN